MERSRQRRVIWRDLSGERMLERLVPLLHDIRQRFRPPSTRTIAARSVYQQLQLPLVVYALLIEFDDDSGRSLAFLGRSFQVVLTTVPLKGSLAFR